VQYAVCGQKVGRQNAALRAVPLTYVPTPLHSTKKSEDTEVLEGLRARLLDRKTLLKCHLTCLYGCV